MKKELNNFYTYLNTKNYSINTIKSYEKDLNQFLIYSKNKDIESIDYQYLRKYLEYLYNKNYNATTISRHISSLKSFFKYLVKNEKLTKNPMLLISNPKLPKKLPNYLNYNDLEKLFSSIDKNSKYAIRNHLILELLYSSGIRVSELINIKISDIDLSNKRILINGKGNKQRYVLFGNECLNLISSYLTNHNDCEYLILNKYGKKITDRAIRLILDDIVKKSALKLNISPHTLRHTFATHMLNGGADLKIVSELLGHSNISTTGIYTHVSNEQLRKVYLTSHPRAK